MTTKASPQGRPGRLLTLGALIAFVALGAAIRLFDVVRVVEMLGRRRARAADWSPSACGDEPPPLRWRQRPGVALATPSSRFERLTS